MPGPPPPPTGKTPNENHRDMFPRGGVGCIPVLLFVVIVYAMLLMCGAPRQAGRTSGLPVGWPATSSSSVSTSALHG